MNAYLRLGVSALTLTAALLMSLPADARGDCASNANLSHVNRRLSGAIEQLSDDRSDYGGHKGQAMRDLQNARNELAAAQQWAVSNDRENPSCFAQPVRRPGNDEEWGAPRQGVSNRNIWNVRARVEKMIDALQRDQHDYDGHRVRAIADMQQAREQLVAAEQWARGSR